MGWFVNHVCHIDCSTACSVTGVWNSPIWIQHWVVLSVSQFPVFFYHDMIHSVFIILLAQLPARWIILLETFQERRTTRKHSPFFCSASWSNTGIINLDKMMLPIMFYFFLVTIALDLGLRSHLLPFRTPQPSPLQLKLPSYPPQLLS
jgi:hypothetical protein